LNLKFAQSSSNFPLGRRDFTRFQPRKLHCRTNDQCFLPNLIGKEKTESFASTDSIFLLSDAVFATVKGIVIPVKKTLFHYDRHIKYIQIAVLASRNCKKSPFFRVFLTKNPLYLKKSSKNNPF